MNALLVGQGGFFGPHPPSDWLLSTGPASVYDTAALRAPLATVVDFDRINAGETRLSVGAVNMATGNFAYFDSARMRPGPAHVMASGALPHGFPGFEIEGEQFWDGGLVSNTPLQHVIDTLPHRHPATAQQSDLPGRVFPARGPIRRTLAEVAEREKNIRYSSRDRWRAACA